MSRTIEELRKYKGRLQAGFNRDIEAFEKNFLWVSAGVLTFTIVFIKDIIGTDSVIHKFYLFGGWILIGCSVGSIIISFFLSAYSGNNIWRMIDRYMTEQNLTYAVGTDNLTEIQNKHLKEESSKMVAAAKKKLYRLRVFSITAFLSGLFSVCIFVSINFVGDTAEAKEDEMVYIVKSLTKDKEVIIDSLILSFNDSTITVKQKVKK